MTKVFTTGCPTCYCNLRRKSIIYSAFIRNHTKEGTFRSFEKDLDRIKALGTDIIWLLPIHPIGEKTRKGKEGSPYAISDFRNLGITLATKLTDVISETMNDPTDGILHHEEGVDLLPANLELSAMEYNLMNAMSRETTLRNYLSQVKDRYEFVLIDCMPSLSMVTLNALLLTSHNRPTQPQVTQ